MLNKMVSPKPQQYNSQKNREISPQTLESNSEVNIGNKQSSSNNTGTKQSPQVIFNGPTYNKFIKENKQKQKINSQCQSMVVVNKNRKSKLLDLSTRSDKINVAMKKNVKIGSNKPLFTQIIHSRTPKSFT